MGNALSRRKFIALAGGSAVAATALAACGSDSSADVPTADETAKFGKGDIGILNYALTLEYVEAAFYAALAKSSLLTTASRKSLGEFGEEEEEHIAALNKAVEKLGGKPTAKPATSFSLESDEGALELASELENVGAAAYLGQLPLIESEEVLATVLSIHSVEGRHAAAIDSLLDEPITPDGAFAEPATVETVLEAIEPFIDDSEESGAKT